MNIVVHTQIADIDADQWNALVPDNNPFIRHEFLIGLEQTKCVCIHTGWQPKHICIYDANQVLKAAMPCYAKDHSYGEYIFDWAWADAYHRSGLAYYPKLSNAVPFTPATGPRLLCDSGHPELRERLVAQAKRLCEQEGFSSFHSLFNAGDELQTFEASQCLQRSSTQFHWHNKNYQDFNDFLSALNSKKRKNIKRERRRVSDAGVQYRWLSGDELDEAAVNTMYGFYQRTIQYYGAQSYLNLPFFRYLASHFAGQTLFLFAYSDERPIAGGLYFKSDNRLYGRYWGALANFHSLHFETCYYQAIEWCIKHGYQAFEAGAQGEHKLARGLEPQTTYSAHWLKQTEFHTAVGEFVDQEANHIEQYQQRLRQHSPFRCEL